MKQKLVKLEIKNAAKPFSWKFWLWLFMLFLVLMIIVAVTMGWAVNHILGGGSKFTERQSQIILSIARFPQNVKAAFEDVNQMIDDDPVHMLLDRKDVEKPNWVRRFPAPEDPGYLLFSGLDPKEKQPVVKLIRIADGFEITRWQPDFSMIHNQITDKKWAPRGNWSNLKAFHPVLLNDGDIIFNTFNSLVRQSNCSKKPIWVIDMAVHHSNELDVSEDGVWSPTVSQDGFAKNAWLKEHIRDDALGHFSLSGKLLEIHSFTKILIENGFAPLLLGTSGFKGNEDPIHMNQIKVAKIDSRYWRRGDLLISARNVSTLFLYRPSTNKILWHRTGPWINQHSADFIDNHRISVFSNNVVSGKLSKQYSFITPNDINQVYIFDFDNNKLSQPYERLLRLSKPITLTEGRAQILPDGGLFIEETNYSRHLRFNKNALLWSRVNDYDDQRIGSLFWSRYITAEEASLPLQAIALKNCQNSS